MSGVIQLIKNFFSGILSFLIGLLGGKKSLDQQQPSKPADELPGKVTGKTRRRSGYFMELDETEDLKSGNGNQPAKLAVEKSAEPIAAKSAAPVAQAEPTPAPEPATRPSATRVELVQTAEGLKAEPAKAEPSPALANANGQKQTETTFAPKYLIPSNSNSRRRPGPNMSTFLDMARQVKTSN